MQKIPTLFVRNEVDRQYVTTEVSPGCEWVIQGEGRATRKWDGTCVLLDENGRWWARREVKLGKNIPPNFVPVHADPVTGKLQGWEPIEQSAFAKFHEEALVNSAGLRPGTFELCGPKINGNPEYFGAHLLLPHGYSGAPCEVEEVGSAPRTFAGLADWLHDRPYEGIVFHHPDGRMAKIKRRDFITNPSST